MRKDKSALTINYACPSSEEQKAEREELAERRQAREKKLHRAEREQSDAKCANKLFFVRWQAMVAATTTIATKKKKTG